MCTKDKDTAKAVNALIDAQTSKEELSRLRSLDEKLRLLSSISESLSQLNSFRNVNVVIDGNLQLIDGEVKVINKVKNG